MEVAGTDNFCGLDEKIISQVLPVCTHGLPLEQDVFLNKQAQFKNLIKIISTLINEFSDDFPKTMLFDPEGYLMNEFFLSNRFPGGHFNQLVNLQKYLLDGKIIKLEIFYDFNNKDRYGECLLGPIFDLSNNLVAILVMGTDRFLNWEMISRFYVKLNFIQHEYYNTLRVQEYTNSIIDYITDCVLIFDNNLNIINANNKCLEILGLSKHELSDINIHGFLTLEKASLNTHINLVVGDREVPCSVINQTLLPLSPGLIQKMIIFKTENINLFPLKKCSIATHTPFSKIIGETPKIAQIKTLAQKIAPTPSNILIQGESGTGKELLAEAIHIQSQRKGPFIAINCGAIPRDLLQSELFGYTEGAFTGSQKGGKIGKLEAADQGTLFLDEIGEMPTDMQVTLLRFLEDRSVVRLGSSIGKRVDVRIISATNRDLKKDILNKNFREDLYYRLNVFQFNMPPLRHRKEDIPLLIDHMVKTLCREYSLNNPIIEPSVMHKLSKYEWPGNVRELRNIIEVLLFSCQDSLITADLLPKELYDSITSEPISNYNLKDYEQEIIINALKENNGHLSLTADDLGITRKTLYNKLKKYNIKIINNNVIVDRTIN